VLFIREIDLDKSERILAILFGKRFPEQYVYFFAPFHRILINWPLQGADIFFSAEFAISRHVKQFFPQRYTQIVNHKKVFLYKPKTVRCLSGVRLL
jgi:hypothetical protein